MACRVVGQCEVAAFFLKKQHGLKIELSKLSRNIKSINVEDTRLRSYDVENDDYYPDRITHFDHLPQHLKHLSLRQFVEQYDVVTASSKSKNKI